MSEIAAGWSMVPWDKGKGGAAVDGWTGDGIVTCVCGCALRVDSNDRMKPNFCTECGRSYCTQLTFIVRDSYMQTPLPLTTPPPAADDDYLRANYNPRFKPQDPAGQEILPQLRRESHYPTGVVVPFYIGHTIAGYVFRPRPRDEPNQLLSVSARQDDPFYEGSSLGVVVELANYSIATTDPKLSNGKNKSRRFKNSEAAITWLLLFTMRYSGAAEDGGAK